MTYLPYSTIIRGKEVCSRLRNILSSKEVWRYLLKSRYSHLDIFLDIHLTPKLSPEHLFYYLESNHLLIIERRGNVLYLPTKNIIEINAALFVAILGTFRHLSTFCLYDKGKDYPENIRLTLLQPGGIIIPENEWRSRCEVVLYHHQFCDISYNILRVSVYDPTEEDSTFNPIDMIERTISFSDTLHEIAGFFGKEIRIIQITASSYEVLPQSVYGIYNRCLFFPS